MDTAGLGTASDEAEAIRHFKGPRRLSKKADVRIWVADGSAPPSPFDLLMAERLRDLPHVVAVNKSDLPGKRPVREGAQRK